MSVLVPDKEDPTSVMKRGGLEVTWRGGVKVKKFNYVPFRHVVDQDLALPTLYLHFLHEDFHVQDKEFDPGLRSGNDNSEQRIVLPEMFTGADRPEHSGGEDLDNAIRIVMSFLKSQATMPVSTVTAKAGGFSPKKNYTVSAGPDRWYFSLKASRPKSEISLDKPSFGIPEDSDLYLFAENHASVAFMTEQEKEAFETCIEQCGEEENEPWRRLAIFLKIFYEGAFAYNQRISQGQGVFLPKMTGLAALGVVSAFEGQAGIATGYPYLCKPEFLQFSDTVPVTIRGISALSDRHKRYGLCFTRSVFVWEPDDFDSSKTLNFCSPMPHGGFFYVPETLGQFNQKGGLVYAFGDDKESFENALGVEEVQALQSGGGGGAAAAATAAESRPQACVICLEEDATHAAIPCGHRAYCQDCSARIRTQPCPVCRVPVRDVVRIY